MNIHFIAIGGSAMHNLAIALHQKGYQVFGSDDTIHDPSKSRLEKYGLLPEKFGWFPEKISSNLDVIILGMHARKDNPELKKAQELGLKTMLKPHVWVIEQGWPGEFDLESNEIVLLSFLTSYFKYTCSVFKISPSAICI